MQEEEEEVIGMGKGLGGRTPHSEASDLVECRYKKKLFLESVCLHLLSRDSSKYGQC